MSTPYVIDNEGIGSGPYLTMSVAKDEDGTFRQQEVDDNLTACVVTGRSEVGKGNAGDKLAGKVVWVSTDLLSGTTIPVTSAVQMRGCARFKYSGEPPRINDGVVVDGAGGVARATKGHPLKSGQVIAVDLGARTCDVWLG